MSEWPDLCALSDAALARGPGVCYDGRGVPFKGYAIYFEWKGEERMVGVEASRVEMPDRLNRSHRDILRQLVADACFDWFDDE